MAWGIEIILGFFIIIIFILISHWLLKRKIKKIERRYNIDEDKSKRTGETIDSRHYGYRTEEGTTDGSGPEPDIKTVERPKRRTILPNDVISSDGEDNIGTIKHTSRTERPDRNSRRLLRRSRRRE